MSLLGLFGRTVAVEIGPEGGLGVRLGQLRVGFRVEHKAEKHPSSAQIRIYNPSPASIGLLRVPLASVRLLVGYEPLPRLIFQGTPVKGGINLQNSGADRILTIDASDGGRTYQTLISISYTTPTTFGQVLAQILAQTQWTRGYILIPEATVLPHGIVLFGTPAQVLDRLAESVPPGADWYVRDNALYMVPRGATTPEIAPLLSSRQGNLIGSPVQTKDGIRCKALIDETMRPGRAFLVESSAFLLDPTATPTIPGLAQKSYTARDVTFEGDSGWESPFYMSLSGKALGVP